MAPQQPETQREGTALPEPERIDPIPGKMPEWVSLEPVKGGAEGFQLALNVDALTDDE